MLYIFWFLHQTTTNIFVILLSLELYIFWFLHQTTTAALRREVSRGCISFDSYIKPQLLRRVLLAKLSCISFDSYIKPQLCASDTSHLSSCISFDSYIKPQRRSSEDRLSVSCISFDSYIKPQLIFLPITCRIVVYLLIPTSNHNHRALTSNAVTLYIFWFLHQTTTKSKQN